MSGLKKITAIIFFALTATLVSGRGVDPASGGTEPGSSQRIVQVGSSAFIVENALYLFPEAYDQVVAVADGNQGKGLFVGDIDPNMPSKTVLPRRANTEAVMAERPDVVVMKNFMKNSMGEALERVGAETVYLNLETPEAWFSDLDTLGSLFDNSERAEELKGIFRRRIAAVEGGLSPLEDADKPDVLLLYWSVKNGENAVNVPPLGWIQTRMVEMAGGKPVWREAELGDRWTTVGIEQIAAWNPDIIVVTAYHVPAADAVENILSDPTWATLSAVKSQSIYAFPGDYHSWDQPDVRWLLGLAWLADRLHPELFPDFDPAVETRIFYEELFGLDDTAFDKLIAPRLTGIE